MSSPMVKPVRDVEPKSIGLVDGRRFRVEQSGTIWRLVYLKPVMMEGMVHGYVEQSTKPVYDEAVWVMWLIALEARNPE